ncbi:MAG TPA: RHS repeat-associated core domain-containing protein [Verrucomicrobiae bacterium]|nr:RHS repeat-associated core domain-containing protein [Verrucomicrobiae bacterium]
MANLTFSFERKKGSVTPGPANVDGIGTTAYSYDQVGQLLSEGGLWPKDTVNYTNQNRLRTALSLAHPNGSAWAEEYGYDDARRLKSVESSAGTFDYTYDPVKLERVDALGLPNGAYITNTFDSVARILSTALMNSAGTNLDSQNYVYNTAGQRTSETNAAGDHRVYTYDNEGELSTSSGSEPNGSTRLSDSWSYFYDAAGNITEKKNSAATARAINYGFNSLNEITNATIGNGLGFLTPVAGSTSSKATGLTVNGSSVTPYADNSFYATMSVTNGPNAFTAIAWDSSGDFSTNTSTVNVILTNTFYGYDQNGNLTNDGFKNFAYDDENELIAVWVPGVWSNSFAYDGKMRRRIERDYSWDAGTSGWTETNEVHFIYDGNLVVEERNASNILLVSYTHGLDLNGSLDGAGGIGGLLARTTYGQELPGAPTTAFYHADGNGNVTALMYSNQQLAAKYLYDPFGNMLAMSGPLMNFNKYRFSSKEWNDNAGLYYYLYRFYEPSLQRWPNRDPIRETGGINLYTFMQDDPANHFDALGLCRDCSQEYNDCMSSCMHKRAPWPWENRDSTAKQNKWGRYNYCEDKCQKAYMECEEENEEQQNPEPNPASFCSRHPAICGTEIGIGIGVAVCIVCPECCLVIVIGGAPAGI